MRDITGITDHVAAAMDRARGQASALGMRGWGVAELRAADGTLKQVVEFTNLITTAGDQYYAKMAVAGVGTPAAAQPTLANGMKLGTGGTAVAKSSTGASIVTYISGSNQTFDSSYPQTSAVGTDVGWYATYRCVWAAGDSTATGIAEVVVCIDAASDDAGSAAETISRALFSTTFDKGASDTLTVTWNHKFLGA